MCGNIEGLESRRAALSSLPSLHHLSSHASLAHEGARRTVLLATCERPRKGYVATKPLRKRRKDLGPFLCLCHQPVSQPADPSLTAHTIRTIRQTPPAAAFFIWICAKSKIRYNSILRILNIQSERAEQLGSCHTSLLSISDFSLPQNT